MTGLDQVIIGILGGELGSTSLLMLFILGLLTKRFVPWWVHEGVLEKLNEYEKEVPALSREVKELIAIINEPDDNERVEIIPQKTNMDISVTRSELKTIQKRISKSRARAQQRKRTHE